jgi:hypothetical protein
MPLRSGATVGAAMTKAWRRRESASLKRAVAESRHSIFGLHEGRAMTLRASGAHRLVIHLSLEAIGEDSAVSRAPGELDPRDDGFGAVLGLSRRALVYRLVECNIPHFHAHDGRRAQS